MKAILKDEIIIQVFSVTTEEGAELRVTWNRDNHTEDQDVSWYIPEFEVQEANSDVILEKGCQDWEDAVEAVRKW